MKIKKLQWDSSFFGYEVGKIDISSSTEFDWKKFKDLSKEFKLIYVFSKDEILVEKLKLVDVKITFYKKLGNINFGDTEDENIVLFDISKHNYEKLKELSILSGKYSRFNLDENFSNEEFRKLYLQWIDKTLNDTINSDILIYLEKGEILGFITLENKNKILPNIGLVAVSNNARGKGVGTRLIESCQRRAFKENLNQIQVVTQKQNIAAVRLYEKCGFEMDSLFYISHFWKL